LYERLAVTRGCEFVNNVEDADMAVFDRFNVSEAKHADKLGIPVYTIEINDDATRVDIRRYTTPEPMKEKEAVILVDGVKFVIRKIDNSHFGMRGWGDNQEHEAIWHIEQIADAPYYAEVKSWLRDDDVDLTLREYHWEKEQ
jgi:hypothetical protein